MDSLHPSSLLEDPKFEMEMERLDAEIEKTRKQLYGAVLGKKRQVKRTWLEINALTNAHILQMLPYKAMLSHVAKLADERDKIIEEIVASKVEKSQMDDFDTNDEHVDSKIAQDSTLMTDFSTKKSEDENLNARDEAVQTEESSFPLHY